jgi:hypothetical protein
MPATPNYQHFITKAMADSWDLKGVTKRSIALKLKQQNKKTINAIKNALASLWCQSLLF